MKKLSLWICGLSLGAMAIYTAIVSYSSPINQSNDTSNLPNPEEFVVQAEENRGALPHYSTGDLFYQESKSILADPSAEREFWQSRKMMTESFFSSSEVGSQLALVAAYSDLQTVPTEEGRKLNETLERLRANPEKVVEEVAMALPRFTAEFESSRQFLFQWVNQLDIGSDKKIALLQSEIERYAREDSGEDSSYGAAIALDALMRVNRDQAQIGAVVFDYLQRKGDQPDSRVLLSRFGMRFPEKAKQLATRFGIENY